MLIYRCWTLFYYCDSVKNMSKWCFTSPTAELKFSLVVSAWRIDKVNLKLFCVTYEAKQWQWINLSGSSLLKLSMAHVGRGGCPGARVKRSGFMGKWFNMCIVTWSEWPLLGRLVFWIPANKHVHGCERVRVRGEKQSPDSTLTATLGMLDAKSWKHLLIKKSLLVFPCRFVLASVFLSGTLKRVWIEASSKKQKKTDKNCDIRFLKLHRFDFLFSKSS